ECSNFTDPSNCGYREQSNGGTLMSTKPASTAKKRRPTKTAGASTKRRTSKSAGAKQPSSRLAIPDEAALTKEQRQLIEAIRRGPRGPATKIQGPFAVYLHAPEYGQLTQELGAFMRYNTQVPHRLSEFAILCTARHWRANFEWFAHAPIAEKAGVKA